MKPDTIILTQQSFDKLFRLYQRKLYAVAYTSENYMLWHIALYMMQIRQKILSMTVS